MKMFTMIGESELNDVYEVVNKYPQEDDIELNFHQEEEAFIPVTVIEKQTNEKEKVKNSFYLQTKLICFSKSHL